MLLTGLFSSLNLLSLSGNSFTGYPSFGGSGRGIQWVTLFLISPNSPNHDLISQLQSAQTVHFASFLSLTHAIYFAELVGSLSLTLIHSLTLSALPVVDGATNLVQFDGFAGTEGGEQRRI